MLDFEIHYSNFYILFGSILAFIVVVFGISKAIDLLIEKAE